MDADRFDDALRAVSHEFSRRGLLTGLTSLLLAVTPFELGREDADARKKRKKKRRKKRRKKKNPGSSAPRGREVITRIFTNASPIIIPAGAPGTTIGRANPYPSSIEVSGFTNGVIRDVDVFLNGFEHTHPDDVDILLSATHLPDRYALIMSDAGGDIDVVSVNLVLDDQTAVPLPFASQLSSGTFQPTNYGGGDSFPAPAPAHSGRVALSEFTGQNPNGTWQLWVLDDTPLDVGQFAAGWRLQITAEVDV
jgi:hypothetical protein